MKPIIFITGTGTDVGKTIVAGLLARGLACLNSEPCWYWKPIQTGGHGIDATTVSRLAPATLMQPDGWSFDLPASPDQAARHEGTVGPKIDDVLARAEEVVANCGDQPLIIEGAGGLVVPFNEEGHTWLDVLRRTDWPVLLVGHTGLGTLNHTSLSWHALSTTATPSLGIVWSGERHAANELSLQRLLPEATLFHTPLVNLADQQELDRSATDLATFVSTQLQQVLATQSAQANWPAWDQRHAWHPYTQHHTAPDPLQLVRAEGAYLETSDGRRLLDGNGSWWVNTIGHGRREIGEAMARQQRMMDHVIFAGATHAPAATLCERLSAMTEHELPRVFFSDNGSTAVEVALKMAYQSWVNRGVNSRPHFLSFNGSYHGDTFGTMSVGASDGFHAPFKKLLFKTKLMRPATVHCSSHCPAGLEELADVLSELDQLFAAHHEELAGVIVEPMVQGAGGMLVQPTEFLQRLGDHCRNYDIPLIFDEVFTGLGRLGAPFAYQRAGVTPDIICLAKGLTGGTVPLAVTLTRDHYFEAFLSDDKAKALLHGHSFTGNPIACAAANATLDLFERLDLPGRARALEERFQTWLATEGKRLEVTNPRSLGGILAFELPGSGDGDYFDPRAARIPAAAASHGLFIRPLGNTVYLVPPLTITNEECTAALEALSRTIESLN